MCRLCFASAFDLLQSKEEMAQSGQLFHVTILDYSRLDYTGRFGLRCPVRFFCAEVEFGEQGNK